jgi:prepilin-type N-terminal cleavage/methylation domain-containing protein
MMSATSFTVSPERRRFMRRRIHGGFTLVELLVVITIIGILIGLLMPAVSAIRESARRAVCTSNLSQLGKACLLHEEKQGFFPSGGWSYGWAGDPSRGFTSKQPGGWHYNILPYIEQTALHEMGGGGDQQTAAQRAAATQRAETPVAVFICPTRHKVTTFPYIRSGEYHNINNPAPMTGRSDYAACSGELGADTTFNDPSTLAMGDSWNDQMWEKQAGDTYISATGVIFRRSMVQMAHIRHGISCTYLIGERYINPDHYYTGDSWGNDQGWDEGYDDDTNRWTGDTHEATALTMPMQDTPGYGGGSDKNFGSAHVGTFGMVMCDGSVHRMNYTIDPNVHRLLGVRNKTDYDGTPIIIDLTVIQ